MHHGENCREGKDGEPLDLVAEAGREVERAPVVPARMIVGLWIFFFPPALWLERVAVGSSPHFYLGSGRGE